MSRRIVTPVDPVAFNAAQVAYLQQYPNPQPQPGSRAHRQRREAWLNLYAHHGGAVDPGDTFQAKDPGNVVEPCPLKNVITSVAFLSGSAVVNALDAIPVCLAQHTISRPDASPIGWLHHRRRHAVARCSGCGWWPW